MKRKISASAPDGKVNAPLLAPREVVVAGLAARYLTPFGGHRVRAIGEVLREMPGAPVIHVGGELLTCDVWEAAVMLLPPKEAPGLIAQFDGKPQRFDWARRFPGWKDRAPYCLGKSQSPQHGEVIFNGVGGVDPDRRDATLRGEVLAKLGEADWNGGRRRFIAAWTPLPQVLPHGYLRPWTSGTSAP